MAAQERELGWRLDLLGARAHPERGREAEDGGCDGRGVRVPGRAAEDGFARPDGGQTLGSRMKERPMATIDDWFDERTLLDLVPPHKRLATQPPHLGLPIGNLSSQFFANIYLDALDQFAKHQIKARHYIRYVDDFILLHESAQWLNAAHAQIQDFLPRVLGAQLNPTKTILQPVDRGVDFVGHVIKPWCSRTRRRTVHDAISRISKIDAADVFVSANSYFGLLRQAGSSHADRAVLARAVLRRGHCVNHAFTKTYRAAAKTAAEAAITTGESNEQSN